MHKELLSQLNIAAQNPSQVHLGETIQRSEIPSCLGPFNTKAQYHIEMPAKVLKALMEITKEYNSLFSKLVEENLETENAYQYAFDKETQEYINYVFQIDMRALPQDFLITLDSYDLPVIKEVLKRSVFEFEDSLAMLNLLRQQFEINGESIFRTNLDSVFDSIRDQHSRPIALLATTEEKLSSILACELGVENLSDVSDQTVRSVLGYDTLIGPKEYQSLLKEGREKDYLLYVRSSSPVRNLRNPKLEKPKTILDLPEVRRSVLEQSITLNLGILNDTKRSLLDYGLGLMVSDDNYQELINSTQVQELCESYGISEELKVRVKPLDETFGCYGHHSMQIDQLSSGKKARSLKKDLKNRGEYILQPEIPSNQIIDENGDVFNTIHRNFVGYNATEHMYVPIEGVFTMMPANPKARITTVHGSHKTMYSPVIMK